MNSPAAKTLARDMINALLPEPDCSGQFLSRRAAVLRA
jgi:hypothetical protein